MNLLFHIHAHRRIHHVSRDHHLHGAHRKIHASFHTRPFYEHYVLLLCYVLYYARLLHRTKILYHLVIPTYIL